MKEIIWSDEASVEFLQIVSYVSENSPTYALNNGIRIQNAIQLLTKINVGRKGRVKGTFEKSVYKTPYVISYLEENEKIVILRVIHTSQDFKPKEIKNDNSLS